MEESKRKAEKECSIENRELELESKVNSHSNADESGCMLNVFLSFDFFLLSDLVFFLSL